MIGTLMIAGLCLALGAILGYAYSPVRAKFLDPLNQTEMMPQGMSDVVTKWRRIHWRGPSQYADEWRVRHNLMEPMLDALGIKYNNDTRKA